MKLFVPVFGMFVASGICCCCGGGDDWAEQLEDLTEQSSSTTTTTTTTTTEEPTVADAAPDAGSSAATPAPSAAPTGNQEGLCGRFKSDGMSVPTGLKVLVCSDSGGTESVVMQGSGEPKDVCAPIKAWATGAGWTVTTEASMMGTVSIILKNADKQLTVACTNATGQTTASVSISQGY